MEFISSRLKKNYDSAFFKIIGRDFDPLRQSRNFRPDIVVTIFLFIYVTVYPLSCKAHYRNDFIALVVIIDFVCTFS